MNEDKIKIENEDEVVQIKDATQRDGEYTQPTSTGWKLFDDALIGGWREGDLITVTGISGQGKTLVILNLALNLALKANACLFFSYEVLIDNLYAKIKEIGVDGDTLKIYTPKKNLSGNTEYIREKIKESINKFGVRFVFIDDLDFLSPSNAKSVDAYRQYIGYIIRQLKTIALEFKITIFIVAHVKKIPQGRALEMQDIAESGDTFKKADHVLAVTRNVNIEKIGGVKTEVYGKYSTLRLIKNRLTGEHVMMEFYVENNKVIPLNQLQEMRDVTGDNNSSDEDEIIVDDLNF